MMKTKWINFYIRTVISFLIYYLLNLYINYNFCLNIYIITILFVFIILIALFFIMKNYSVYLCGIITTGIFQIFLFVGIIYILHAINRNIGESGFGIFEIVSLIPLLLLNVVFLIYNCYKFKKLKKRDYYE